MFTPPHRCNDLEILCCCLKYLNLFQLHLWVCALCSFAQFLFCCLLFLLLLMLPLFYAIPIFFSSVCSIFSVISEVDSQRLLLNKSSRARPSLLHLKPENTISAVIRVKYLICRLINVEVDASVQSLFPFMDTISSVLTLVCAPTFLRSALQTQKLFITLPFCNATLLFDFNLL